MAVFGRQSIDGSSGSTSNATYYAGKYTCPTGGNPQSITFYGQAGTVGQKCRAAIYRASDLALIAYTDEYTGFNALGWNTLNFSGAQALAVLTNQDYYIFLFWDYDVNGGSIYWLGSGGTGLSKTETYIPAPGALDNPIAGYAANANAYDIYCTYLENTPIAVADAGAGADSIGIIALVNIPDAGVGQHTKF